MPDATCSIEGCERRRVYGTTGWCQTHYHRWWRHGNPHAVRPNPRPVVKYRSAHARVAQARGRADKRNCVDCGQAAEQWAYDHSDENERVELLSNGATCLYSLDVNRYVPLCRSCHRKRDHKVRAGDPQRFEIKEIVRGEG